MAFQINASCTQELYLEGRNKKQVLVLLLESIKALKWTVGNITHDEITAFAGISLVSFGERITIELEEDRLIVTSYCLMPQFFAWWKNKRNIRRLSRKLNLLWENYSDEALAEKYLPVSIGLIASDSPVSDKLHHYSDIGTSRSRITSFLSIFNPKKDYFVTPILIDLNIFYFLCTVAAGCGLFTANPLRLVTYGANFGMLTLDGQWWRLFTGIFMHAGCLHLLFNMYVLLFIGLFLEPILGTYRFLLYYLLTGLIASLSSVWIHPAWVSVGASGAIFGLFGILLALLSSGYLIDRPVKKALLTALLLYISLNLLNGIKGNVDNAAHIGGLVSGFLIGLMTIRELRIRRQASHLKTTAFITLTALVVIITAYKVLPNDLQKYQAGLFQFAQYESMAMRCYQMPYDTPKDQMAWEIRHQSIGFWHQCEALIRKLNQLHLPEKIHQRNQLLLRYCHYRLKNCAFELQRLQEDDSAAQVYRDSIDFYNDRIQEVVYDLQL